MKTKPTQHSAKELRASGIQPNSIICRSDIKLDEGTRSKISNFHLQSCCPNNSY